jgi:hypothetical protein
MVSKVGDGIFSKTKKHRFQHQFISQGVGTVGICRQPPNIYVDSFISRTRACLKGLSHEMVLAFDDMYD